MNPQLSSIVSVLFILIGILTVLIMLKLQGDPKDKASNKRLILSHRILGYIFLFIFLVMLFFMVKKVSGLNYELSPRAVIHIVLATILIPIFLTKILIARFFKRLYPNLILLGLMIFFLSFTMVAITAGYHFLKTTTDQPSESASASVSVIRSLTHQEQNNIQKHEAPDSSQAAVKELIHKKCTTCHTLERIKKAKKTNSEWRTTVEKMIKYSMNPDLLTEEEISMMISYLTSGSKEDL
jgi:uncharacterized membrane protein